MKGLRRKVRELAMGYLYQKDSGVEAATLDPSLYARHFHVPEEQKDFFYDLVDGVSQKLAELDAKIQSIATHWKISRMARVDRTIMRMACWEMLYTDTPRNVVIDEAVELARKYSTTESASFVNGILDHIE